MTDHPGTPTSSEASAFDGPLEWTDARDRRWAIDADPSGITLTHQMDQFRIPADRFALDLYVAEAGVRTVVRLTTPEEDVGFLVRRRDAAELLRRIAYSPPEPKLAELPAGVRLVGGPQWPKMSILAIWSLIFASLAFLPFVGIAFAIGAIMLIVLGRARLRPDLATLHIRWVLRISAVLVTWGIVVSAFATWTWTAGSIYELGEPPAVMLESDDEHWLDIGLSLLVVLISLSFHEAGHAISAWWCGDDYAKSLGRVTLNPRSHIDPFGTVILPLVLTLSGVPAFGYAKPVPVTLQGVQNPRRAHILISIAGPGANLLLAAAALSLLVAFGCVLRLVAPGLAWAHYSWILPEYPAEIFSGAGAIAIAMAFLKLSFLINVMLAAFNLIPIPPLDGSWVLEHAFPDTLGLLYERIRPFGWILFLVLIYSDVLDDLLTPGFWVMKAANEMIQRCILGSF